jgi:DNA-binding MarR family transcriptional regulator
VYRVTRLAAQLEAEVEKVFGRSGISSADFAVLATLRRSGSPYELTQRELMNALNLTSGTISVRIDRLERRDLVRREPDPFDGRAVCVSLTELGERAFDALAPEHLANQAKLIAALSADEQAELARLLQILLVEYEWPTPSRPDAALGLTVAPAHVTQQRRAAVGLPPLAGLLVETVEADSPAADADVQPGDVLIASDRRELRSITCLAAAAAQSTDKLPLRIRRGDTTITTTLRLP